MIKYYTNEEDFNNEFNVIEDINREYVDLREEITHAEYNVMITEKELEDEKENLKFLIQKLCDFEQKYKDQII